MSTLAAAAARILAVGPRLCRSAVTLNLGSRWSPSRSRQALPRGSAHRLA